jgi:replicative DNA helicase
MVIIDALYLCLLAGQASEGVSASNLYQIGPLLLTVAQSCLEVGCTPVLVHHFRQTRNEPYAAPQLADLAFAGIQEFARQWILLGPRTAFDPDDPAGKHELWLSAGGSAGHSLLRAVNVFEGQLDEAFGGRTWRVEVVLPSDARATESDMKARQRKGQTARQQKADEAAVLTAVDELDPDGGQGVTLTRIRHACQDQGVSKDRCNRALHRLVSQGLLAEVSLKAKGGNNAAQPARGYRRPPPTPLPPRQLEIGEAECSEPGVEL